MNIVLWLLIGIFVIVILLILIVGLCDFLNDFKRELKYINCEIKRTSGHERKKWIRQRRRLWLCVIPFVKYK